MTKTVIVTFCCNDGRKDKYTYSCEVPDDLSDTLCQLVGEGLLFCNGWVADGNESYNVMVTQPVVIYDSRDE